MKLTSSHFLKRERGQNLVEFALLTPFIIVFLGAIIVTGLALHTRSNVQQAVREGARQAAVGASKSDVQDLASGNSAGTLDPADVDWCLPPGSDGHAGDEIRVFVDDGSDGSEGFEYELVPATGGIFSAMGVGALTVNMSPRATTRLEKSLTGVPACTS